MVKGSYRIVCLQVVVLETSAIIAERDKLHDSRVVRDVGGRSSPVSFATAMGLVSGGAGNPASLEPDRGSSDDQVRASELHRSSAQGSGHVGTTEVLVGAGRSNA